MSVLPLLRAWTASDASALHAALVSDPALERQLGRSLASVRETKNYIDTELSGFAADRRSFAVDVNGTAVGSVGISAIDPRHQTAWVSYWMAPAARGQSLAGRAVAAAAAWALRDGGVFRLELGHRTNNPASCRVATKAGFSVEGIERSKLRYGNTRFDVETHSRLATDPEPNLTPLPLFP